MSKEYVIIDKDFKFAIAKRNGHTEWAKEYPEATIWANLTEAKRWFKKLTTGSCLNIYTLIENYGLETQQTIERRDMID